MVRLLVGSTNWGVSVRTIHTVVFIWAFSVAFISDSLALAVALIEIGLAVNPTFRLVDLGAVFTIGVVKIAKAVMELPDTLAVEEAFIVIGDAVSSANGNISEGLGAPTV